MLNFELEFDVAILEQSHHIAKEGNYRINPIKVVVERNLVVQALHMSSFSNVLKVA